MLFVSFSAISSRRWKGIHDISLLYLNFPNLFFIYHFRYSHSYLFKLALHNSWRACILAFWFILYYIKKYSFFIVVCLVSNWCSAIASSATSLLLSHFETIDIACDQLLNRNMVTWNLYVKYMILNNYSTSAHWIWGDE